MVGYAGVGQRKSAPAGTWEKVGSVGSMGGMGSVLGKFSGVAMGSPMCCARGGRATPFHNVPQFAPCLMHSLGCGSAEAVEGWCGGVWGGKEDCESTAQCCKCVERGVGWKI